MFNLGEHHVRHQSVAFPVHIVQWLAVSWNFVSVFNRLVYMCICEFIFLGGSIFILYCWHHVCFQVRNWLFSLIGLRNPKDESAQSRRKYDFNNEVLAWRIKLRKERYSMLNTIRDISSVEKLSVHKTWWLQKPTIQPEDSKTLWLLINYSWCSEHNIVHPIQPPPGIDQPIRHMYMHV